MPAKGQKTTAVQRMRMALAKIGNKNAAGHRVTPQQLGNLRQYRAGSQAQKSKPGTGKVKREGQ